ncbi:DUF4861 family protein [Flavobacterium selenitireducens]|uniref:DUF4861 family protein n=1 Tax=Flavobacterium selenitireducens TaxID=2722704 RepID=UPI00168B2827|nr:DUF4861 family protein [Flavobacterium selenitireducens]MBD3581730.1 DUF4861 domain-containing protein [Flavobacterium selenitireducens]
MKRFWIFILASFAGFSQQIKVSVTNNLAFARKEIVSVPTSKLTKIVALGFETIHVKPKGKSENLVVQWLDPNADGKPDELLFQAEVPANSKSEYIIFSDNAFISKTTSETKAFSRFVPERTDDYAWENDKVAFRTYGPDAQNRFEQKRPNGTLSSGIDIWLKRTEKPVVDNWYLGYQSDPMFYHKDRGEGYDPYHVGASRGTGGTGIWIGDSLVVSKNFVGWKTIADGPLRTTFELVYAPFSDFGLTETKRISLDLGSNFYKAEVTYKSKKTVPNYAIGITLHKNEGEVKIDTKNGIFRHFEKIDDAFVGEGVIVSPVAIFDAFAHKSKTPDQSNLIILTDASRNLVYYAGFAWTKSGQIATVADWDEMLARQSKIVANPLVVKISN